jgi:hypothetical protein
LLKIDDQDLTPNEYLEFCLRQKPGVSNNVFKYNGIRNAIRYPYQPLTA